MKNFSGNSVKISHRADIYSKTRSPFLLLSLFVYSLVACTKFLEFVHIYIYIWIYERRTKVNRSVGAEKCKRAGGFAQKTVFFMYRVSLKWFALGVYIILWWSVIAGQMDLFTLRLHYWTFFKFVLTNVFVDLWIFLFDNSIWLSIWSWMN